MKKLVVIVLIGLAICYGNEEKDTATGATNQTSVSYQETAVGKGTEDSFYYAELQDEPVYEELYETYDLSAPEDECEIEDWSDHYDTAPMPETIISEDALIGYWTKNPDDAEPIVVEFYREDGVLKYRYFRVLLGNGNGISIAKEHTIFEYNKGNVNFLPNQGSCYCTVGESSRVYVSFYCLDSEMKTIVDQEDGTVFYRWDEFSMPEEQMGQG